MKRHRLVLSSLSVTLLFAAYAVACGSDDTSGSSPVIGKDAAAGNDATTASAEDAASMSGDSSVATNDAATEDAAVSITLEAGALATTVYAGQSATVDASSMVAGATATFAWSIMSVPTGSAITTASILNADTASATVPTDNVGTYVVAVTASGGGATASATVTITAAPGNVVFAQAVMNSSGVLGSGWTINSDGTGARAITCALDVAQQVDDPTDTVVGATRTAADTFEGAPGTPTKVVFGGQFTEDAGIFYAPLYATDTSASCPDAGADGGIGARLLYTGTFGTATQVADVHPRFSPDGTKVLFNVATAPGPAPGTQPDVLSRVAVIGFDGTSIMPITTLGDPSTSTSGETSNVGGRRQAEWVDSSHIGWARSEKADAGALKWNLVTASVPFASGDPHVVMTCAGPVPIRVAFLADGSYLAVVQTSISTPQNLVKISADANGNCLVQQNYSQIDGGGGNSDVTAFAVSPDGKTVAFAVHNDAQIDDGNAGVVYVAAIDGSTPPVAVAGRVLDEAGLRWVGGGTQVAFTHIGADDAGQSTGYNSVSVFAPFLGDAGTVSDLVTGNATTTVAAVGDGDGDGCNASGSSPSTFASMLVSILGLAFIRRRRVDSSVESEG